MVRIGSAGHDENNKYRGGKAGDQTGTEVRIQNWYNASKGWVVLRAKDKNKRSLIADAMSAACANNYIGYDNSQRLSLFNTLKAAGNITVDAIRNLRTKTECDCSSLVRVCIIAAGLKDPGNFRTANEPSAIMATGDFAKSTSPKYCASPDYLLKGDILVTKTSGHTVVVLDDGIKVEAVASGKPIVTVKDGKWKVRKLPLDNAPAVITVKKGQEMILYGISPSNNDYSAVIFTKSGKRYKGYISKKAI